MTVSPKKFGQLLIYGSFFIGIMIALGGVTRLTGSGLSIVEWDLWTGIFPPVTANDWSVLFQKYQTSPQYQIMGQGMDVIQFQSIFWLEYIHRLWGRFLGVYYGFLAFLTFFMPSLKPHRKKTCLLWILIGIQGVVGWYMVKSGLSKDPFVSPYRLSVHLVLGFMTFGFSLVCGVRLMMPGIQPPPGRAWIHGAYCALTATVIYGAWVAGFQAGLLYPTFPLMGGRFFPEDGLFMAPLWLNFIANPAAIQWTHRVLALITLGVVIKTCFVVLNAGKDTRWCRITIAVVLVQVMMGIGTVMVGVPMVLAALHQLGALALMGSLIMVSLTAGGPKSPVTAPLLNRPKTPRLRQKHR